MSFMSFRLAAPSLEMIGMTTVNVFYKRYEPIEYRIILQEFIEVGHQLIDSFPHVEVSHGGICSISIGERGHFVLVRANGRLEFIPEGIVVSCLIEEDNSESRHVFSSVFDREKVICHGLISKLMHERRHHVQRPVGNQQRCSRASRIWFLRCLISTSYVASRGNTDSKIWIHLLIFLQSLLYPESQQLCDKV